MDDDFRMKLSNNGLTFKMSLDRIIEKYSKLKHCDGGAELDLTTIRPRSLERHMKKSKEELSKLETKSLLELREESGQAQESSAESQLDLTHQNGEADETCMSRVSSVSNTNTSVDDGEVSAAEMSESGISRSNMTQLTVSSLDETQRAISEVDQQPEDQDEELEMSLRRHDSLMDLYPGMISRIERAWHRQHVSEAADSVLRRYRRWRQSNRSLNSTFTITLESQAEGTSNKENRGSSLKRGFTEIEPPPRSSLQMITNRQECQTQRSPGKVRSSLTKEQHPPIVVMDFSSGPEMFRPKEISLNQTFTVSPDEEQQEKQPSTHSVGPWKPSHLTPRSSMDLSLRSKRLANAANSLHADGHPMCTSQAASAQERPDINSSPVRHSPIKSRLFSNSRSPNVLSRSPRTPSMESVRPRPAFTSLTSPQQRSNLPMRMFSQDADRSFQSQLSSPRLSSAAEPHHRLRRHLSFDSSLPSSHQSLSLRKLDEDFIKLYHKFVCQNKSSFFSGPPCRFCARSSQASRSHSSSALAALALSPHRSLLRKRHRELSLDGFPQSKRLRDEYGSASPGSRRHGSEMLRRRLSQPESEQLHDGHFYSPSKRFSSQQRSAELHQDMWEINLRVLPDAPPEKRSPSGKRHR